MKYPSPDELHRTILEDKKALGRIEITRMTDAGKPGKRYGKKSVDLSSSSDKDAKKSRPRKAGLTQTFWKSLLNRITKVDLKPSMVGIENFTELDKSELRRIYEEERAAQGGKKLSVCFTNDLTSHYVRHHSTQYEEEEILFERHLEAIHDTRTAIKVSQCDLTRKPDVAHHYLYGRKLEQAELQWKLREEASARSSSSSNPQVNLAEAKSHT
ncbi:unnamed protein product [Allacma fusca]|uniref:Uncharacterized protein n=1 Tax=Allacma fusca TaxID=39272 RepID=A0A8J2J6B6_9HEXA|nr:unnamed protein product [Allacma fusca]